MRTLRRLFRLFAVFKSTVHSKNSIIHIPRFRINQFGDYSVRTSTRACIFSRRARIIAQIVVDISRRPYVTHQHITFPNIENALSGYGIPRTRYVTHRGKVAESVFPFAAALQRGNRKRDRKRGGENVRMCVREREPKS